MKAGVGYSDIPDSAAAGKQAAEKAIGMSGRGDPCDIVLLFCTARHNQRVLREAVSSVAGASVPIYGGGAVGIITNDAYGYAGDQAGVACLWLDGASCDAIVADGLSEGEGAAGFRLGQGLSRLNVTPDSPVMLFYDAIRHNGSGGIPLIMATWILAGLEKALGFMPALTGAGMIGDHETNPTSQYIGGGIGEQRAMALAFGGGIHIDSTVIHGCRPASAYYVVTKADGPVILEINHRRALDFMDGLLGSAMRPENYPFFLLFGVNLGERWGDYDEDGYASRLCLGIDRERGGIVMFEPDMVEGTEFQLMYPSFDLGYIKPKIDSLFDKLNGREPVFAMYIDCAGRCAGYGGIGVEDAVIVQRTVAGRAPLLGLYSGVEIAPVVGRSRGLDWSGVFCLFSRGGKEASRNAEHGGSKHAAPEALPNTDRNPSVEAVSKLCERNAAEILALNARGITLRYELELKRRGLGLLSELAMSLRQEEDYSGVFIEAAQRINAALNMHKTLVLFPDGAGRFVPRVLRGFTGEEQKRLSGKAVAIPDELLGFHPVIVTGADAPGRFAELRGECNLPFFISSPIFLRDKAAALLLTGRMVEQHPYFTRLGQSDLETVQAIADLLGSIIVRLRLNDVTQKAETDSLTGLWNRETFQRLVEEQLGRAGKNAGAFMMIDADHFKSVNDVYGHIAGDNVIRACAAAMRDVLRDSDIIGRQGGDEFAVFCRNIDDVLLASRKAVQISESWRSVIPARGANHMTASIGISLSPNHGATFEDLYRCADVALYKAKERGRNCYVAFDG